MFFHIFPTKKKINQLTLPPKRLGSSSLKIPMDSHSARFRHSVGPVLVFSWNDLRLQSNCRTFGKSNHSCAKASPLRPTPCSSPFPSHSPLVACYPGSSHELHLDLPKGICWFFFLHVLGFTKQARRIGGQKNPRITCSLQQHSKLDHQSNP